VLKDFKLAGALKYVTDYPTVVVTFAAVMDAKRWRQLPPDVQKVIDTLGPEMAVWTGNYHDHENVDAALEWAKKEHGLKIVQLAPGQRAQWDARLKPMEENWVKEMSAKGLPAAKYLARLHALRDQYSK